jgi:hypothetical protein
MKVMTMSNLPTNPTDTIRRLNPHLYGGAERENNLPAVTPKAQSPAPDASCFFKGVGPPTKRIRQSSKPLLNELETKWQSEMHHRWPQARIHAQSLRFRLANGAWYKPDFFAIIYGFPQAYECKGPRQGKNVDRGLLALKCAASQYPEIAFSLVWKEGGVWYQQAVLP